MRYRFVSMMALVVAVVVVSAACSATSAQDGPSVPSGAEASQTEDTALPAGVDRVVYVELSDFAITADSFEVVPGETVQFNVSNAGVVEHEFRLSNQDRVDRTMADGGTGDGDAPEDAVLLLAGGESGTTTFTFPDNVDDYTIAVCLVPGHYEAGMSAELVFGP